MCKQVLHQQHIHVATHGWKNVLKSRTDNFRQRLAPATGAQITFLFQNWIDINNQTQAWTWKTKLAFNIDFGLEHIGSKHDQFIYWRRLLKFWCTRSTVIMFSRSYCYAVWLAIGIMMSVCGLWVCLYVRPSVRLSLCNAVQCGSHGRCRRRKVAPRWCS